MVSFAGAFVFKLLFLLSFYWVKMLWFILQLDADEDTPNFDEDGRDEYNEIHMLV